MRIAFLTLHFPPVWLAGIELVTYTLASELVKRGHEVHVITALDEGLPEESKENGFTVHRLPYRTQAPLLGLGLFYQKVRRKVIEIDPEVLHIQNILWGWMGASINKSHSIPYVVNAHGEDIYREHKLKGPAIRNGVKRAGAVVALNQAMKERIESFCQTRVFVVPNGVYFERFEHPQLKRKDIGMGEDAKLIAFVGGLRPVKGVQYLLQAMPAISEKNEDAICLIIGDGSERARLQEMAKTLGVGGKVIFLGKVDNQMVAELLCLSDVFVLPSLSEGFALVVLEAMAAGLPLVCTRVRGMPDLVVDDRNGFLVELGDSQQIADRVNLLLESESTRKRMGDQNRLEARNYSWDRVAERFEEIYESIDDGSNPI